MSLMWIDINSLNGTTRNALAHFSKISLAVTIELKWSNKTCFETIINVKKKISIACWFALLYLI